MSEGEYIIENAGTDDLAPTEVPVGAQLRRAREARGLQMNDIAHTLKLGIRQVEAVEQSAWRSLPGNTFIRGFVRNYARFVQLDPAPLMAQLDRVLERPTDRLAISGGQPAAVSRTPGGARSDRLVVLGGMALVLLALLAYFLIPADLSALRGNLQAAIESLSRKSESAPVAPSAADPVLPPGATTQDVLRPQVLGPADAGSTSAPDMLAGAKTGIAAESGATSPQLRFNLERESWIEVRDRDNRVVFSQKLMAGTEQALSAQGPLSITLGYAPGVKLYWHGQAVDLAPHTKGDVARLVLE